MQVKGEGAGSALTAPSYQSTFFTLVIPDSTSPLTTTLGGANTVLQNDFTWKSTCNSATKQKLCRTFKGNVASGAAAADASS